MNDNSIGWKVYLTTDPDEEITRVFMGLVITVNTNLNLIIVNYTMTTMKTIFLWKSLLLTDQEHSITGTIIGRFYT